MVISWYVPLVKAPHGQAACDHQWRRIVAQILRVNSRCQWHFCKWIGDDGRCVHLWFYQFIDTGNRSAATCQNDQVNNKNSKTALNKSKEPPPAAFFEQNEFSVRALNEGIGEWGIRTFSNLSKDKLQDNLFVVMGTLENHKELENSAPPVISRFPWEGFEEIGFRTVKSASSEN